MWSDRSGSSGHKHVHTWASEAWIVYSWSSPPYMPRRGVFLLACCPLIGTTPSFCVLAHHLCLLHVLDTVTERSKTSEHVIICYTRKGAIPDMRCHLILLVKARKVRKDKEMELERGQQSLNRGLHVKLSVFTTCSLPFEQQWVKLSHNYSLKDSWNPLYTHSQTIDI